MATKVLRSRGGKVNGMCHLHGRDRGGSCAHPRRVCAHLPRGLHHRMASSWKSVVPIMQSQPPRRLGSASRVARTRQIFEIHHRTENVGSRGSEAPGETNTRKRGETEDSPSRIHAIPKGPSRNLCRVEEDTSVHVSSAETDLELVATTRTLSGTRSHPSGTRHHILLVVFRLYSTINTHRRSGNDF